MGAVVAISNEGWDALALSVIAVSIAVVMIVYVLKTGKWPWQ